MKSYAIVMAGGVGARFWPYGTSKLPKQFLPIANSSDTMLQLTIKRLKDIVPIEQVFIITNKQYIDLVKKQLPRIPKENIIGEPIGRNTAPCIGLASTILKQYDEKAKMFVVPADHLIENVDEFTKVVNTGLKFVEENDSIVTLGIVPTHPETGYGYIQFIEDAFYKAEKSDVNIYRVKTFAEKPSLDVAKVFLESGDFLWNSGMFIFRADTMLKQMSELLPDLHHQLLKIEKSIHTQKYESVLEQVFAEIKGISIDYGIMEKAKNVYVIKADLKWSDLGSWDEVSRLRNKDKNNNSVIGDSFIKDSRNNLIMSPKGFVGVIGVDDLIIIDTKDGLLICKKDRSQEVKEIVDYLKRKGLSDYI
ncbi:MAG TPA: mannose-1-phosphate guanylyltransferase [Ignavibacteria bacterium]|nr:mannose-1-phosphate guanylyltransferase [Ignavibacteria bacterium]HAX47818.1 mannose-1-phosphate guanylyltransferase [Bacteroidota bacterium]HRE09542.1 mannose-1-phosphate guanylyltransferase [Ignavibacteria bacterium]HRF64438.1 mannose-1-phosphate guanylyltransferase [Ignavibacteria bacterium]HRJ04111.1 mannose-1-phosphate guanylyltransferase [Ignavibacteria bacterium]